MSLSPLPPAMINARVSFIPMILLQCVAVLSHKKGNLTGLSTIRNKFPLKRYRVVTKNISCVALNRNLEIAVFRIAPLIHNRHHFNALSFQPEAPGRLLAPVAGIAFNL